MKKRQFLSYRLSVLIFMKNKTITLYHTLGCHLCDDALALASQIIYTDKLAIGIEQVDIVNDDKLLSQYGEHIPVFKRDDGSELSYPFERKILAQWLKSS